MANEFIQPRQPDGKFAKLEPSKLLDSLENNPNLSTLSKMKIFAGIAAKLKKSDPQSKYLLIINNVTTDVLNSGKDTLTPEETYKANAYRAFTEVCARSNPDILDIIKSLGVLNPQSLDFFLHLVTTSTLFPPEELRDVVDEVFPNTPTHERTIWRKRLDFVAISQNSDKERDIRAERNLILNTLNQLQAEINYTRQLGQEGYSIDIGRIFQEMAIDAVYLMQAMTSINSFLDPRYIRDDRNNLIKLAQKLLTDERDRLMNMQSTSMDHKELPWENEIYNLFVALAHNGVDSDNPVYGLLFQILQTTAVGEIRSGLSTALMLIAIEHAEIGIPRGKFRTNIVSEFGKWEEDEKIVKVLMNAIERESNASPNRR